jgi:flp/fap pilin component
MDDLREMLVNEESGQGMAEYGLIIAFIAVVCVAAVKALGTNVNNLFNGVKFSN